MGDCNKSTLYHNFLGTVKIQDILQINLYMLVDYKDGNTAREHGTDPEAVETLSKSLSKGWDSTEYLPAVRKLQGGVVPYELIYGFFSAVIQLTLLLHLLHS